MLQLWWSTLLLHRQGNIGRAKAGVGEANSTVNLEEVT